METLLTILLVWFAVSIVVGLVLGRVLARNSKNYPMEQPIEMWSGHEVQDYQDYEENAS